MARLVSSLKEYVVDWWKRHFGKTYIVKAEGESTAMHDFRKCPKCGARVSSLDTRFESKCGKDKCDAILIRGGEYMDKKERLFKLKRPLHSKFMGIWKLFLIVCTVSVLLIFRVKHAPPTYSIFLFSDTGLTILALLALYMATAGYWTVALIDWFGVKCIKAKNSISELFFGFGFIWVLTLFAIVVFPAIIEVKGVYVAPFWVHIPTQQEIYNRQKATLENMPLTVKRFSYAETIAENPLVNLQEEYILVAENDFVNLVKFAGAQRLALNSQYEQRFYLLYAKYLNSLDEKELAYECSYDPLKIATGYALERYPDVWTICK